MKPNDYEEIKRTAAFVIAVFAVIFALTALVGTEQPEPPAAVEVGAP